ncbi:MAG: FGGY family carbohydrate kinase [Gammaproteobacteria bacterium]
MQYMPGTRKITNAALAIDLGSTRFKLGCAAPDGRLVCVYSVAAPRATGEGLIREIDPPAVLRSIELLWNEYPDAPAGQPLGLVCQRSTFLIWDRESGRALTPLVSWQDRRAADWCTRHVDVDAVLRRRAGLLLSPHYAGPKLAAMLADDDALAARLNASDALFGNLDAWLTWVWTDGAVHRTDLTMAARTGMADIVTGDWSDELLDWYRVPRAALPEIVATDARPVELGNGLRLGIGIADQASGALASLGADGDAALVNLGTGGFVLRPVADADRRVPGYLTAPIFSSPTQIPRKPSTRGVRCVLEGTINGAGPAVAAFGAGPVELPNRDHCQDGFAIPDMTGIGSPHWRPEVGLTLSPAARRLGAQERRRVVVEGLLFRVFEILRDLGGGQLPRNVRLSGGLANEPGIARGLASLLGRPVEVLDEPESGLLGAARLALGLEPQRTGSAGQVEPSDAGAYLSAKFPRWVEWMRGSLGGAA